MKAIRGAITAGENTPTAIADATCELLGAVAERNGLVQAEVVSVLFTLTPDLNAAFPARAARLAGWDVPMLDMQEVDVPGALPFCIRLLVLVQREEPVRHVYLRDAVHLRPDLKEEP